MAFLTRKTASVAAPAPEPVAHAEALDDFTMVDQGAGSPQAVEEVVPSARVSSSVILDRNASQPLVLDHQGPGRLVFQPDGSVAVESGAVRSNDVKASFGLLPNLLAPCIVGVTAISMVVGGLVGVATSVKQLDHAFGEGYCVTSRMMTRLVTENVSSSVAGVITGVVYGPILASKALVGKLLRPALFVGAAHKLFSFVYNRRNSIQNIIHKLQSGQYSEQLEALYKLAMQAAKSAAFRQRFASFGGVELLVDLLSNLRSSASLHLVIQCLIHFMQDEESKKVMLDMGVMEKLESLQMHSCSCIAQQSTFASEKLGRYLLAQSRSVSNTSSRGEQVIMPDV